MRITRVKFLCHISTRTTRSRRRDDTREHAHMSVCVCVVCAASWGWRRATMDFPIPRCLLVRASTLPPGGIILRPRARSEPRSGSLTLEVCAACLCTAVIYSLFSEVRLELLSRRRIAARVEVNQDRVVARGGRAKFVDFEPSERGEFVDIPPRHPMYREPSWKRCSS